MLKKRKKTVKSKVSGFLFNSYHEHNKVDEKAREVVMSLCAAEGFKLIHLEHCNEGKGRVFRVYIDKPGGITLDDCATLSRTLGDIIDVELGNCGSYTLEVSSPGIEHSAK